MSHTTEQQASAMKRLIDKVDALIDAFNEGGDDDVLRALADLVVARNSLSQSFGGALAEHSSLAQ